MIGHNGSVGLRNDGLDALTGKIDLNAAVGVLVTVRIATVPSGTGAIANLFDINDAAIANPITTDNFGNYFFKIDEGTYDIIAREGTPDVVTEPSQLIGAASPFKRTIPSDTLDLARADVNPLNIFDGAELSLKERTAGNGGGAIWDVVLASTVTPNTFNIVQCVGIPTLALVLRIINRTVNVKHWGAIGDGDLLGGGADDSDSLQAAATYVADNNGFEFYWPPGYYRVTKSINMHRTGETLLQRNALLVNGDPVVRIGDITVNAYNAKIVSNQDGFTTAFPFFVLGWVGVENVKVLGLEFESDCSVDWFDSTNYSNTTPPEQAGNQAMMFSSFKDVTVKDCKFLNSKAGCTLTDDRQSLVPIGHEMDSYRSIFSNNYVFNCPTGLSMTYGATEQMIIVDNFFDYTFIKLVKESDQGRGILFKNNTCRDVSNMLINGDDFQLIGNTFNNLLGGIFLQPQGGLNPSVTYTYNIFNMMIKDNTLYSDHLTPTQQGDKRPQSFISILSSASLTVGQTVLVDSLSVEGNKMELWPIGGTSSGAFISRAGDADLILKNPTFINNDCDLNNSTAVIASLAPLAAPANTFLSGNLDFSNNTFNRFAGNANFEFQFFFGALDVSSSITFNDNECNTQGTGNQVSISNVGRVTAESNKFSMGLMSNAANGVFKLHSVPKATIEDNNLVNPTNTTRGSWVVIDGATTGVYDTALDKAVYRVNNNDATELQFAFGAAISFPASAEGFYEITGNVIEGNATGTFKTYGTIIGFSAENVVNPSRTGQPPANDLTPGYYTVWNGDIGTGNAVGWVWSTSWLAFGTQP